MTSFFRLAMVILSILSIRAVANRPKRTMKVSIKGEQFYINGQPTFKGRVWNGHKIEGLLPNSRMVQGIFDDWNPKTYPFLLALTIFRSIALFRLDISKACPEGRVNVKK